MSKLLYKFPLIIGLINIFTCSIYFVYDKIKDGGIKKVIYLLFHVMRPEYMIISGIISVVSIIFATVFTFNKKTSITVFVVSVIINVMYIFVYLKWMTLQ